MTMSRPEPSASPLTVKEQFEASAKTFWSSVRKLNVEDTMKRLEAATPAVSTQTGNSNNNQVATFQSVMHAVFRSCATGAPYSSNQPICSFSRGSRDSFHHPSKRSVPIDASESSSAQDAHEQHHVSALVKIEKIPSNPPKATATTLTPKINLFRDSHESAERVVLHLREQQWQQQHDLKQRQHQRQKEYERAISCRAVVAKSSKENQSTNIPHSTPIETAEKEPPSFFPISKPSVGHNHLSPHDSSKNGSIHIPIEVSSPFHRSNPNAQPAALEISYGEDNTKIDEDLFDFDDGVSAITQVTVDEMIKQLDRLPTDFPNDFLLNRVYSDITDPISPSFLHVTSQNNDTSHIIITAESRTMLPPPTSNTDNLNMFPPEGRTMSPPRLTRQNRSSDTRSFYTKTTNSTYTDDFSAWKQEEQRYWDSLVAKEESITTAGLDNNKSKLRKRWINSGLKTNTANSGRFSADQIMPPSPRDLKLQRVRQKAKRNIDHLNAALAVRSHEASIDHSIDYDRKMDAMIMQHEAIMGEI